MWTEDATVDVIASNPQFLLVNVTDRMKECYSVRVCKPNSTPPL